MIAFRDFTSKQDVDGVDGALVAANEWLLRTGVRPLNVETIRSQARGSIGLDAVERGLRVWYEAGQPAPAPGA